MTKPLIALDARLVAGTHTGDSTYWTSLLESFQKLDQEFRFLLLSNAPRPDSIPESELFQWQTIQARSSRIWSLWKFPSVAKRAKASVVHTQYSLSPLIRRNGVTTIHDVSFFVGPQWFPPKDRLLLTKTISGSVKRARAVITVSETSKKEIETAIPASRGKVSAIYDACPSWIQPMRPEEADPILADLGVNQPFLLTVGTKWPRKNLQLALDASNALPLSMPHKLIVTGKDGWGDLRVGARAQAVGYVTTQQLSALYSRASLYLAPSHHEGFGIPILEAFRCGCPVICSNGGALPEVAGGAAHVMVSWEPLHWARHMADLLNDSSKLDDLSERGLARERDFSWDKAARETLDVYRQVIG